MSVRDLRTSLELLEELKRTRMERDGALLARDSVLDSTMWRALAPLRAFVVFVKAPGRVFSSKGRSKGPLRHSPDRGDPDPACGIAASVSGGSSAPRARETASAPSERGHGSLPVDRIEHDERSGRPKSLEEYALEGFADVQGWTRVRHLEALEMLDEVQRKNGISGNVAEIGVYHGKLLLALAHLAPPGSTVLAIDVFDEQQWNLDGSGEGSLEALRENIDRYGPSGRDYRVVKADSLALTAYDKNLIMTEAGPFRMFSVDGCHTAEHVFNDLLTAQDLLSPGGVIILDDYMQPHWPGVTEAVHRLYAFGVPRVKPFLYCDHKLYLTHYGHHNLYYEAAKNQFGADSEFRSIEMFGSPVVALYPIP